ncbi:hypothetical protein PENDEC_c008G05264 [Penicillium decumbens]|uniref:Gfo/Idh/MocA-like oxidoreductase N-terminal domain-containing protein n=1 Tax=Penicillium decumbens TaxID=69771 RepID=A0A1V6PDV1_PENDC|nr:hypothetical protein PENDEC_c008G05264 [Penicillium decumbens]
MPIGVAIVGSGLFAKEQHLPAVRATANFQLKAIYSRSLKSAQALAEGTSGVDLYSEDAEAGKSFDDLLDRSDIGAVIIGLPILVQPEFIKRALLAGKNVLSEKPIAKDVATAQELLQWYEANIDPKKSFWAVGENFRFMTKFLFTAEQVQKMGKIKYFRVNVQNLVKEDNKYYQTAWRKIPEYQGGFLLDGGVHMTAGLRLILGPERITTLSAQSQLQQEYLPPVDTVDAVVQTESAATGIVSLSWGSQFSDSTFEFACEKGVVTLKGDDVTVNGKVHHIGFDGKGVGPEVAEFATAIVNERPVEKRLSPEAALADLEVLEQMLKSEGWKRTSVDRPLVRASVKFSRLIPIRLDNSRTPGETLQHRQNGRRKAAHPHRQEALDSIALQPTNEMKSPEEEEEEEEEVDNDGKVMDRRHIISGTNRFRRHQSDRFMRVDPSWRKPKGIDNAVRRRFKGQIAMPSIGYGSNKKTRHMMPSGHKAFLVHNPKDVELLLMHNRTYAAEIGHAVSSRKRVDILAKAKALGVKVTNPKGRVTTEA